jgi:DNA-binding protein H-NS
MARPNLRDLDVDGLLELRAEVDKALAERGRDLQRQLALLGSEIGKRRGRPAGRVRRPSVMKGKKVAPKYRGPGGETWAGRGATPRWLAALLAEGHSIDEFFTGSGGRKATAAAKKKIVKKKSLIRARRTGRRAGKQKNKRPETAAG